MKIKVFKKLYVLVGVLCCLLLVISCSGKKGSPITSSSPGQTNSTVTFTVKHSAGETLDDISKIVATITAPDISPVIVQLTISQDRTSASGSAIVPVGANRKIVVEVFDSENKVIFRGEKITNIVEGENRISMTLNRVTGEIIFVITLPSVYIPPSYTEDNLTDAQKIQLKSYIDTARAKLFKGEITEEDFNSAKQAITSALALSPNSPDANLLGIIIDVGVEGERIAKDVLYTSDTIFPIAGAYNTTGKIVMRATQPVAKAMLSGIDEGDKFAKVKSKKSKFTSDNPSPSEVQQEIEANTLQVLNGIISKANKVLGYVNKYPAWKFSYPKNPEYPILGDNFIDKSDIEAISGALYLVRGSVLFGLSYNVDGYDYWKDKEYVDTNNNGKLEPSEYFPPSPFGTVRNATYLTDAKNDFVEGLKLLTGAVETLLAERSPTAGYSYLTGETISDIKRYKSYLYDLISSFSGIPTVITLPETIECWRGYGWWDYYYTFSDKIFDPSHNAEELEGCQFSFTAIPEQKIKINLGALFTKVDDWRTVSPVITLKDEITGERFVSSFTDATLNGIFPDGVKREWFDTKTAKRDFNFWLYDISWNPICCEDLPTEKTLKVGDKIFTHPICECSPSWCSNEIRFINERYILPTGKDVYTLNSLFGTPVTLTIQGYNPISFLTSDSSIWKSFTLTTSSPKLKSKK